MFQPNPTHLLNSLLYRCRRFHLSNTQLFFSPPIQFIFGPSLLCFHHFNSLLSTLLYTIIPSQLKPYIIHHLLLHFVILYSISMEFTIIKSRPISILLLLLLLLSIPYFSTGYFCTLFSFRRKL